MRPLFHLHLSLYAEFGNVNCIQQLHLRLSKRHDTTPRLQSGRPSVSSTLPLFHLPPLCVRLNRVSLAMWSEGASGHVWRFGPIIGILISAGLPLAAGRERRDQPGVHTGQASTPLISTQRAYLGDVVCAAGLTELISKIENKALWVLDAKEKCAFLATVDILVQEN